MRVFIVRHGQTNWNLDHKIQGVTDVPLNETGLEQAGKIANRLRLEKIDTIITSPLSRAKVTAETIAKYHPKTQLVVEKELKELCFGKHEGMDYKEFSEKEAKWNKFTPHEIFTYISPGGESREQKVERLIPVIKKWKKEYKDKTILLSTHGGTKICLLIAFQVLAVEDMESLHFGNTALSILKPFDMEQIEVLNDSSHLDL